MEYKHISVMARECLEALQVHDGGLYIDATLGGAGHTLRMLQSANNVHVLATDLDQDALQNARTVLKNYENQVTLVHANFKQLPEILQQNGITQVDGVLFDLGVSSYQLDNAERGFSFRADAELDMRMNLQQTRTAKDIVNTYSLEDLTRIFKEYGEERFAKLIANKILKTREKTPITSTLQLKQLIMEATPQYKQSEKIATVTRIFQAIRIEVNDELSGLYEVLVSLAPFIKSGGRMVVLTFHSLEDRIVKNAFKELTTGCICPPDFPICVCGHKALCKPITHKPVVSTAEELAENARASSAKLRVVEKL